MRDCRSVRLFKGSYWLGLYTAGEQKTYSLRCRTSRGKQGVSSTYNILTNTTLDNRFQLALSNAHTQTLAITARACNTFGCSTSSAVANTSSPCHKGAYLKADLGICWICPRDCGACIDATRCTECKSGKYILSSGGCFVDCGIGEWADGGTCKACKGELDQSIK